MSSLGCYFYLCPEPGDFFTKSFLVRPEEWYTSRAGGTSGPIGRKKMARARKLRAADEPAVAGSFAIDRRRAAPPQVYEILREKIITGELRPGESINERRLATWLGVSRTPIREAIQRLSDNGLVAIVANVGTSVAEIDAGRMQEFFLIRASLEGLIIRRAAIRIDDEGLFRLRQLIDQQTSASAGPDVGRNIGVDNEFHRTIAEISGLDATWTLLQQVMAEMIRVRHISNRLPRHRLRTVKEHQAILDALASRDADRCEHAMRSHLDNAYRSILVALAQESARASRSASAS
jgi:DNA-binding GntR family transcriptional regulator